MNKLFKITISILAAFELIYYLLSPLLVVLGWSFLTNNYYVPLLVVGICATLYRGIKVGFLKE